MEDKPPQPNVFNKVQWMITFCYVEYKILKELFLKKVFFGMGFHYWKNKKMEAANNFFLFLAI
jgi:hypothetical protein